MFTSFILLMKKKQDEKRSRCQSDLYIGTHLAFIITIETIANLDTLLPKGLLL